MGLWRRGISLLVFLAAVYVGMASREGSPSLAGLVGLIIAVPVGFFALVMVIFNLQVFGRRQDFEESGWGLLSERQGNIFGAVLVFLLGLLFFLVAAKGIRIGLIPAIGSGPDVAFARAPLRFVLLCVFWSGLGGLFAWLAWKVATLKQN